MRLFAKLYQRVMIWSRHPNASYYLAGLSFAESSFFPVPPDVMLAPMSLSKPERAWYYAGLTTLASVIGGMAGYLIGAYAFELISPWLHQFGYWDGYTKVRAWFDEWGLWVVFMAGFSPIPYKIFTISAGVIAMSIIPFILASLIGRGLRFYLVAGLMAWGGPRMEAALMRYVDWLGWALVGGLLLFILLRWLW